MKVVVTLIYFIVYLYDPFTNMVELKPHHGLVITCPLNVEWNYSCIRRNHCSLGIDKFFYPALLSRYNGCNYKSMLALKFNHIGKRGPSPKLKLLCPTAKLFQSWNKITMLVVHCERRGKLNLVWQYCIHISQSSVNASIGINMWMHSTRKCKTVILVAANLREALTHKQFATCGCVP